MIEATREIGNLLDILLALWDDPSVFCPSEIWLRLARAFSKYLFRIETYETKELERTIPRAQDLVCKALCRLRGTIGLHGHRWFQAFSPGMRRKVLPGHLWSIFVAKIYSSPDLMNNEELRRRKALLAARNDLCKLSQASA